MDPSNRKENNKEQSLLCAKALVLWERVGTGNRATLTLAVFISEISQPQ